MSQVSETSLRRHILLLARAVVASALLIFSCGVFAETGDSVCTALYPKSGAVQGTPSCPLIAASNTPTNMGTYYCVSDPGRIQRWCGMPPDLLQADASCPVADPVNPDSGSTTLTEEDFVSGDGIPLVFSRTYRSRALGRPDAGMGGSWFHNWQRQLGLANAAGSTPQVIAWRDNGDAVTFGESGGSWHPVDGAPLALAQGTSTWTLTDLVTGAIETYSAQGVLLSLNIHGGQSITLTYSDAGTPPDIAPAPGLLIALTEHAAGQDTSHDLTLGLRYDARWRITEMDDPVGGVTRYGYDDYDNLVSVTWPDGNTRRYVYSDPRFTSALTSVINETGASISTWTYDAQGRVLTATHPDAARNVSFGYGNGQTVLGYDQQSLTMDFSSIANRIRPTNTTSANGRASTTWSAAGNVLSQSGVAGSTHTTVYDAAGRPAQATHVDPSGTTRTSVTYADATSMRAATIVSSDLTQAFVYDPQSNLTGLSDWTDSGGKITYGFAYRSSGQLSSAQVYAGGKLAARWSVNRDASGNVGQMVNQSTGATYTITTRDNAHRALVVDKPDGEASFGFDARGRVSQFGYQEYAAPSNGNVSSQLEVTFNYAPDGLLLGRTGTVSTNGGPPEPISSAEMDQWIRNWNAGVVPVAPAANLRGWVRGLLGGSEPGLVPVIAPWEAMFAEARIAWRIYQIARDDPAELLADRLKEEIRKSKCADIPPQLTRAEQDAILQKAANGRGLYGLGEATREDAQILGEEWVGPGYRESERSPGILISKDGLRQYRPASGKPNSTWATTGVQANFESRNLPSGEWVNNGHLNIRP